MKRFLSWMTVVCMLATALPAMAESETGATETVETTVPETDTSATSEGGDAGESGNSGASESGSSESAGETSSNSGASESGSSESAGETGSNSGVSESGSSESTGESGDNSGSGETGGNEGTGESGDNSGSGETGGTEGSGESGDNSGSGETGGNEGSGESGDNSGSGETGGNEGSGSTEETPEPEVTPDPTQTPDPEDDTLLKMGSQGDAVTRLQQKLTELGYYNGPISGNFGENTRKAVRTFQRAHGLSVDGIVGKNTRAVLYGGNAIHASDAKISSDEGSRTSRDDSGYTKATPKPTQRPVYEYDETQVWVQADGYEIPATVIVPVGKDDEQYPCVVMCHGYGSNRHEAGGGYEILAPLLAKNGIATIRFDYKGCGDSEEDYIDFTFADAIEEAMLCYEYMTARSDINNMAMGIMGWSMGGAVALLTAGQYDMFDSVLTWAAAGYDGTINQEEYETAKAQGYFEATFDWRDPLRQSPAYYESMMEMDVLAAVENINPPIMAIHGKDDTVVSPETAENIIKASNNKNSELMLFKNADHTFNILTGDTDVFEDVCNATVDWFYDTLYGI